MRKVDLLWFILISEVLTNLCAAWIGAAILTPFSTQPILSIKLLTLTVNILFGILSILLAFWFRKKGTEQ